MLCYFQHDVYGLLDKENAAFTGLVYDFFVSLIFYQTAFDDFWNLFAEVVVISENVPDRFRARRYEYCSGSVDDTIFQENDVNPDLTFPEFLSLCSGCVLFVRLIHVEWAVCPRRMLFQALRALLWFRAVHEGLFSGPHR